ncbi:MAG: septum formation initiator family protein [Patescibacteria group bacterium]|nr:septum formation initiator family protein [Patescibacteria group bacterium]
MVNRNHKSIFKKIFFSQKFFSLIGLVAIVLISWPFAKNAMKQYGINKEISEFKKEITALEDKNEALKKMISDFGSDQFAEEQARLNFNLKKPGEELMVIKDAAGDLSLAGSSSNDQIFNIPGYNNKTEPPRQLSNREKWLNYFFR